MSEIEEVSDERHELVEYLDTNRGEITAWKFTMPLDDWLTAIQHYAIQMDEDHEQRWRSVSEGDVVFFHSTQSTKIEDFDTFANGIIGVGIVSGHDTKTEPWWYDEINGNRAYSYLVTFERLFVGHDLSDIDLQVPISEKELDVLDEELVYLTRGILDYDWINDRRQQLHGKQFPAMQSLVSIGDEGGDLSMDFALSIAKEMASRLVEATHPPLVHDTSDAGVSPVMVDLERQLEKKKQAVLYGPPGTGKTYTAEEFAEQWIGFSARDTQIQTVTFHPSFSYEDFIEGLTTNVTESGVTYDVEPGIFRRIAKEAREAYDDAKERGVPSPEYVLIIDEINRGNLAQIFGETITLLEADKRLGEPNETDAQLAHSDETLVVPPNLYLIGTMNTADQSISLVDAALRRRFRFVHFPPDYDLLCTETGFDGLDEARETLIDGDSSEKMLLAASILALQGLNSRIIDAPNLGKGKQVGHTNLLNLDGEEEIVDAWRFDILPLLEEYYFGQFNRLRRDLFDDGGEELIDWEAEEIERFGPDELFDTLLQLAGFNEDTAEFESGATDDGNATSTRQEWTEEMLFDQTRERLEPDEAEALIDLYEFAGEVGQTGFGSGKKHGKALMYHNTVNTSIAVFGLGTGGEINFRWGWLDGSDNTKSLPPEAVRKCSEKLLSLEGAKGTMSSSYDAEVIDELPISSVIDSEPRDRFKQAIREFIEDCQSPTVETEVSE
jgi:DNA polymerase III delta prime subunit